MAIQTLSDLKALINSTIYDNTTNEISGSDVQTALINAIDTLDSAEGFVNVHKANGQTTITEYGSKSAARSAVPADFHYQGIVIAYKLSTGWVIEQNLDATAGTWSDDASWVTTGPVSVSQNTDTGGVDIVFGGQTYNVAEQSSYNNINPLVNLIDYELLDNISIQDGKYLDANGNLVNASSFYSKYTERINCKEGDVFYFYGRAQYAVYGWCMRNNDTFVSVGQPSSDDTREVYITIPSGVNNIQFSSYAITSDVTLTIRRITPVTIKNQINTKVPTESYDVNRLIKKLFVDVSNYTGSLSTDGLMIRSINIGYLIGNKYYWGFALANGLQQNLITNIWEETNTQTPTIYKLEMTVDGIYLYCEFDWDSVKDLWGTVFVKTQLTPFVQNTNCDPRIIRPVSEDNLTEDLKNKIDEAENGVNVIQKELAIVDITEFVGYLHSNGEIAVDSNIRGKKTQKLPCSPNEKFQYKGLGEYSAVSVLFYNDDTIVSSAQYSSQSVYTEITIPSGVNFVVFASYNVTTDYNNVILDVYRSNPTDYQHVIMALGAINPLYGKKVGWDGDSISAGAGYSGGYGNIIATRNNMTNQNISVSGGTITQETYYIWAWKNGSDYLYTPVRPTVGMTAYSDSTMATAVGTISAYDRENNTITVNGTDYAFSLSDSVARHWISSSVNNLDTDCDYIIVEGGINDMWNGITMGEYTAGFGGFDPTTYIGAIDTMFSNLYLRFPGKKIGFVLVHSGASGSQWSEARESPYVMNLLRVCKKWGIPVCDLNISVPPMAIFPSDSALKETITDVYTADGDGCHPNEQGYLKYYCDKIEAWMKTL